VVRINDAKLTAVRMRRSPFYISYCNETAQETAFVERMSRRYKDGRRDLSWLNRAKCAELCGHVEVLFAPIREQV
jgi:hypothetical protein